MLKEGERRGILKGEGGDEDMKAEGRRGRERRGSLEGEGGEAEERQAEDGGGGGEYG